MSFLAHLATTTSLRFFRDGTKLPFILQKAPQKEKRDHSTEEGFILNISTPRFAVTIAVALLTSVLLPLLTPQEAAHAFGLRRTPLTSAPVPPPASTPAPPVAGATTPGATSCKSGDPDFQCIGLKMVSYLDDLGTAVITEEETRTLVQEMNSVWNPCKIGFQLENYQAVNPTSVGLKYDPYWQTEATSVRATFSDSQTFLVVAVGVLSSSTIAVTQMPFSSPFGTLVEKNYAHNALTVGHELGHYMGLYHYRDSSNLMNPYIGTYTGGLQAGQCSTARATNSKYWPAMLR